MAGSPRPGTPTHAIATSAASAYMPQAFFRDVEPRPPPALHPSRRGNVDLDWHLPLRQPRSAPPKRAWSASKQSSHEDDRPSSGAHLQSQWLQRQRDVAEAKEVQRTARLEAAGARASGKGESPACAACPASLPAHLRLSRTHTASSTAMFAPPARALLGNGSKVAASMRRAPQLVASSSSRRAATARSLRAPPQLPPWLETKIVTVHEKADRPSPPGGSAACTSSAGGNGWCNGRIGAEHTPHALSDAPNGGGVCGGGVCGGGALSHAEERGEETLGALAVQSEGPCTVRERSADCEDSDFADHANVHGVSSVEAHPHLLATGTGPAAVTATSLSPRRAPPPPAPQPPQPPQPPIAADHAHVHACAGQQHTRGRSHGYSSNRRSDFERSRVTAALATSHSEPHLKLHSTPTSGKLRVTLQPTERGKSLGRAFRQAPDDEALAAQHTGSGERYLAPPAKHRRAPTLAYLAEEHAAKQTMAARAAFSVGADGTGTAYAPGSSRATSLLDLMMAQHGLGEYGGEYKYNEAWSDPPAHEAGALEVHRPPPVLVMNGSGPIRRRPTWR